MGVSRDVTIRTLTKQLEEALALVKAQAEQIKTLSERVATLENELAKAKKDSSNSSKPPSSDIVNPKKAAKENCGQFSSPVAGTQVNVRSEVIGARMSNRFVSEHVRATAQGIIRSISTSEASECHSGRVVYYDHRWRPI